MGHSVVSATVRPTINCAENSWPKIVQVCAAGPFTVPRQPDDDLDDLNNAVRHCASQAASVRPTAATAIMLCLHKRLLTPSIISHSLFSFISFFLPFCQRLFSWEGQDSDFLHLIILHRKLKYVEICALLRTYAIIMVIPHRRFGRTYRSHPQGSSSCLGLLDP